MGHFKTMYGMSDECKLEYATNEEVGIKLARMGHLAFYDFKQQMMVLFGGQRSGDKYK